jgi:heme-degrading monooxygenase HmoA
MFARIVAMRLKPNAGAEFTQTIEKKILPILRKQKGFRDEMTFVTPDGTEAVGISLWDGKQQAEAYSNSAYPEVMKELAKVVDGTPRIQTYEVSNSTAHNIAARTAA